MVITTSPETYVDKCIEGGKHEIKKNWGKAAMTSTVVVAATPWAIKHLLIALMFD